MVSGALSSRCCNINDNNNNSGDVYSLVFTDKGEHTALYKINNKCTHKTSEIHEHYCIAASYKAYCFPIKPTVFKIEDDFTLLSHSRN